MTDNANQMLDIQQAAQSLLKHDIGQLQVIPALAIKLINLSDNKKNSAPELIRLIESEPTLADKIINNVNSIAFPIFLKIKSIEQATKILGHSNIKQIALNQLIYNKLIYHKANFEFEQISFWQHCLYVATLSRTIATALNHNNPGEIYIAGLLHDIGKLILETYSKLTYSNFIRSCKKDNIELSHYAEHDFFGLSHTEMGFVFCQHWHLPEFIMASTFCHHDIPDGTNPFAKYKDDIAIINLANYIASMQGIGSTTAHCMPTLEPEVINLLDMEKININKILSNVDIEMQNTCAFFDIKYPDLDLLRATLVKTAVLPRKNDMQEHFLPGNISISSLTIPHRSLNPDIIIPATLKAIQEGFHFERLIMLDINPKQRSLETSYCWPISLTKSSLHHFNIKLDALPDVLLSKLRERKAVIINNHHEENRVLLEPLRVDEFLLIPIVSDNRLVALLYADNYLNHNTIDSLCITQIEPIIHELGIALANAKCFIQQRNKAELDALTGLSNSQRLTAFLNNTFKLNMQQLSQIAVGFIDIDYFKQFNDSCGHQIGDEAIIMVAQIMRSLTRPGDFVGRYGGDEFVFVLQSTDKQGARSYAERIRLEVEQQGKILSRQFHEHKITISVGVSLFHKEINSPDKIISAADRAMYKAKQQGRNCVVII